MRKIIFAALAATFLLALVAGTASALRSISVNNTRTESKSRALTFKAVRESFGVVCEVTFLRTLSAAFPKTIPILTGSTIGVRIENCRDTVFGAAATVSVIESGGRRCGLRGELCPVAWRLFYQGFVGTLPRITGTKFDEERTNFLIEDAIANKACEYEGDGWGQNEIAEATGAVTGGRALAEHTQRLKATLRGTCETSGEFRGSFGAPVPGVTIRLI